MTTIELLMKGAPWLLALISVIFGLFRHQQAKVAAARADQRVAEANMAQAQNDAALAAANRAGAQTGADNAKVRIDEDTTAAAIPAGNAGRVLHDEWGRD